MSDVMPSQLANSVLSKFYDVLTNGDESVPPSEDNFFSWCTPGMPVDAADFDFLSQGLTGVVRKEQADILRPPGEAATSQPLPPEELERLRAQDTARLYMQAENFARLVDFIPDVAKGAEDPFARLAVLNNEGSLSEVYARVLTMSQVAASEIPEETKQKIEKYRGLLNTTTTKKDLTDEAVETIEPSEVTKLYMEKMAAYEEASLGYQIARIDALTGADARAMHLWSMSANVMRNRVKAAMADWVSNGYKVDFEKINAFIDQVMSRDLTLLKQAYRDDMEKARLTGIVSGSDFYYSSLVPGNFATSSGWTKFSFKSGDMQSRSTSSYQNKRWNVSGGASYLGIFGGKAGRSESSSREEFTSTMSSSDFSLEFEIAQLQICRPWLHQSFMQSQSWRFDPANAELQGDVLSDGGAPPRGMLPAYPTSIVFVRNLQMSLGNSESFYNYLNEKKSSSTSAGGYVSFGPFFLGGTGGNMSSTDGSTRDRGYTFDRNGISVAGMQIAGFKCAVNDQRMPNPLQTIENWV